jgi:hypothetical protein
VGIEKGGGTCLRNIGESLSLVLFAVVSEAIALLTQQVSSQHPANKL